MARQVLQGVIKSIGSGYMNVEVGGFDTDEKALYLGATVTIRRKDTPVGLLNELRRALDGVVDRGVFSRLRNDRVKDIFERIDQLDG